MKYIIRNNEKDFTHMYCECTVKVKSMDNVMK